MGWITPVDVSEWVSSVAFTGCSASAAATSSGRILVPHSYLDGPDREPVRLGELREPFREEARERNEHLVARAETVGDRRLETSCAAGGHEEHVGRLGTVELLQALRDVAHDVPESWPTVVHERAALGQ